MYATTQKGFTLVELMIVVTLIGILSAWGIPQYTEYMASTKFTEAHSALSIIQNQMEQYYQDNRTYLNAAGTGCGINIAAQQTQNFTVTCTATATTYTATATGTTGKGVDGFSFTLNELNAKSSKKDSTVIAAACWAKKRNGMC